MYDISIIIPVYNVEQYLEECLNSALKQTIAKKEIICIDDGSSDGSLKILQKYECNYKEIHVLKQKNMGAGEARNTGLRIASGEFVCFLDPDDYYWDNSALEQMVHMCRKNKVKICGSFRKRHNMVNGKIEDFELHRSICEEHPEGIKLSFLEYQNDYYFQNYIFDLHMIRERNIFFPNYKRYQDPPFFLRAMLSARNFWVVPIDLYCYRIGHQNAQLREKYLYHILTGIRDNMKVARENQLYDLQKLLVHRINLNFHRLIVNNFSRELFNMLCEIEKEIVDKTTTIKYLEEIWNYYEVTYSYYIMRVLYETKYKGVSMEKYLQTMGITQIAIYGLGTFGMAVYNELKYSSIKIVCGIDKREKKVDDLKMLFDVEDVKICDAIIVTPIKNSTRIIDDIKSKTPIPTYALLEIIRWMDKSNLNENIY